MSDFWWQHVVAAKLQLQHCGGPACVVEDPELLQRLQQMHGPSIHPYSDELKRRSGAMVAAAPRLAFDAQQTAAAAAAAAALKSL